MKYYMMIDMTDLFLFSAKPNGPNGLCSPDFKLMIRRSVVWVEWSVLIETLAENSQLSGAVPETELAAQD